MSTNNEKKYTANDLKINSLEQTIVTINETLIRFEKRFDQVDLKLSRMDDRIYSNFKWLLGMMIGGFVGILGIMAHGFHWL